jgi:hypothetical protein
MAKIKAVKFFIVEQSGKRKKMTKIFKNFVEIKLKNFEELKGVVVACARLCLLCVGWRWRHTYEFDVIVYSKL